MPHVSQHKIDEKLFEILFNQLATLVAPQDEKTARLFFSDLFTKTEKIMLVKRLAIIAMLKQGCSSYEIWTTLRMSPSTVARIQDAYEKGAYKHIESLMQKRGKTRNTFLDTLEKTLNEILSQYSGKRRWSWLKK